MISSDEIVHGSRPCHASRHCSSKHHETERGHSPAFLQTSRGTILILPLVVVARSRFLADVKPVSRKVRSASKMVRFMVLFIDCTNGQSGLDIRRVSDETQRRQCPRQSSPSAVAGAGAWGAERGGPRCGVGAGTDQVVPVDAPQWCHDVVPEVLP